MLALLRKEINSFFGSVTGYVVLIVFLSATGIIMWVLPGTDLNVLENGYATMDSLFIMAPWLFLFLIPAITMKMFSEELKSGTIELLLTKPVTEMQIVTAKYAAGLVLVLFAILPTLVYYLCIYLIASPAGNVDSAGIAGSYLGLLFLCSGFVSIGVFCSSLSGNQIVAFILAVILSYFFLSGFELLSTVTGTSWLANLLSQAGIFAHYESLSRGVIDSRDLVYFASLTLLFLFLTHFMIERRKRA